MPSLFRFLSAEAWGHALECHQAELVTSVVHLDWCWVRSSDHTTSSLVLCGSASMRDGVWYFVSFIGEGVSGDPERVENLTRKLNDQMNGVQSALEQSGLTIVRGYLHRQGGVAWQGLL